MQVHVLKTNNNINNNHNNNGVEEGGILQARHKNEKKTSGQRDGLLTWVGKLVVRIVHQVLVQEDQRQGYGKVEGHYPHHDTATKECSTKAG